MKLVRGNKEHGNLENSFRTIRCATSEDSDHLLMQGQADFTVYVCCSLYSLCDDDDDLVYYVPFNII